RIDTSSIGRPTRRGPAVAADSWCVWTPAAGTRRTSGCSEATASSVVLRGGRRPQAWEERVDARLTEMIRRDGDQVVVRIAVERADDRHVLAGTKQLPVKNHALDPSPRHRS